MRYIVIILWIACLGACNPDVKQKVTVNGKLTNYKGNKIYFEISGRDSLVKAELDSAGRFSACLELDEGTTDEWESRFSFVSGTRHETQG